MQMTTDHLLANPCDDEEDNMAMLCCHTNGGEMFLMTRYPDEDELEITLEDEPSTLDGVKVTLSPTRLLIEIGAGDTDVLRQCRLQLMLEVGFAGCGEERHLWYSAWACY